MRHIGFVAIIAVLLLFLLPLAYSDEIEESEQDVHRYESNQDDGKIKMDQPYYADFKPFAHNAEEGLKRGCKCEWNKACEVDEPTKEWLESMPSHRPPTFTDKTVPVKCKSYGEYLVAKHRILNEISERYTSFQEFVTSISMSELWNYHRNDMTRKTASHNPKDCEEEALPSMCEIIGLFSRNEEDFIMPPYTYPETDLNIPSLASTEMMESSFKYVPMKRKKISDLYRSYTDDSSFPKSDDPEGLYTGFDNKKD